MSVLERLQVFSAQHLRRRNSHQHRPVPSMIRSNTANSDLANREQPSVVVYFYRGRAALPDSLAPSLSLAAFGGRLESRGTRAVGGRLVVRVL